MMRSSVLLRCMKLAPLCLALLMIAPFNGHHVSYAEEVTSQEGELLQDEIRSLRDAVQHMQNLQKEGTAPSDMSDPESSGANRPVYMGDNSGASSQGDLVVQLMERVKTLEQHDRELHGEVEQMSHDLRGRLDLLSKQMGDQRFAERMRGSNHTTSSEPARKSSEITHSSGAPAALLNNARVELQKHNFSAARDNALSYIDAVKGVRKIEGKLVLAKALMGEKEYRQAAVAYYDAYNLSPHTITGPQALLGVTSSLMELGNSKAACEALAKLRAEYPTPSSWVSRAVNLDSQKAHCNRADS